MWAVAAPLLTLYSLANLGCGVWVLGREVTITWGVGCVASKEKEVLPLRVVRTVGRVTKDIR